MGAAQGAIAARSLYGSSSGPRGHELSRPCGGLQPTNFGDALKSCEQMEQEILAGKRSVRGVGFRWPRPATGGA